MADTTSRVFASFSTGSPQNASLKCVGTHNGSFHCDASRSLMADTTSRVFASFSTGSPHNASLKCVGTHNGSFHCDEALGCFMIRLTDKFSNAEVVRTRDPQGFHQKPIQKRKIAAQYSPGLFNINGDRLIQKEFRNQRHLIPRKKITVIQAVAVPVAP